MKITPIRLCLSNISHQESDCLSCQRNALIICFVINFIMFAMELVYGLINQSSSLLGDSAHNFGDAFILGSSVLFISSNIKAKAKLALIKCIIWFLFGLFTLYHAYANIITQHVPYHLPITLLGTLALVGNIISTFLLLSYKNKDVNLKSAYICVRNDAFGNILIIAAGLTSMMTGSYWPDPLAGLAIGLVVLYSSSKIAGESLQIIKSKG